MGFKEPSRKLSIFFAAAGLYFLLDLPARLMGFLGLQSFSGPKNFLPLLMGVLLGPWSVPGMCFSAIICACLCGSATADIAAEVLGIPLLALGSRLLWYCKNSEPPRLKHGRDCVRFFTITAVTAPLASVPAGMLLGMKAWRELTVCYGVFTVFLGIPVMILISSILCILPVCPKGKTPAADVDGCVYSEAEGLDGLNEQMEAVYAANGFPVKKAFAVENCLEELVLRIQCQSVGAPIHVRIYLSDSASVFLNYSGARYNPLRRQAMEKSEDFWGLSLIRARALQASYRYVGGENRLHIVI